MQTREKKKTWDTNRFRQDHMTFWPKNHSVMLSHLHTDHWSKMKTMVPGYLASVPIALLKSTVYGSHESAQKDKPTTRSLLPPVTQQETATLNHILSVVQSTQHNTKTSPQNMPLYRNVFNDHARRGFCYWNVEKRGSPCKTHSFGAYKTSLGLPKM